MEIDDLNEAVGQVKENRVHPKDNKQLAKQIKGSMEEKAKSKGVELIYRRQKA